MKILKDTPAYLFCNEAVTAGAAWLRLCEYGHYPNAAGMQDCTREGLALMVNEFQARKAKAGDRWRGDPITMGHRDRPNKHLPHMGAKLGKVLDIQLRDDGPYVQVAWNSLGEENIAEGWAEFPSPEWYVKDNAKRLAQPVKFKAIGMVETPNIPTSEAWTNEDPEQATTDNTDPTMNLLESLRAFLALNEDADEAAITLALNDCMGGDMAKPRTVRQILWLEPDATAEQVKAAMASREADLQRMQADLDAMKAKLAEEESKTVAANERVTALEADLATATEAAQTALNEKLTTAETDLTTARAELATANAARRDLVIDLAINEGRAAEADREILITAFNEDFAGGLQKVASLAKRFDTRGIQLTRKNEMQRQLNQGEAQAQFIAVVNEHQRATGKNYQTAFNECLANKEHAALVLAMNGQ